MEITNPALKFLPNKPAFVTSDHSDIGNTPGGEKGDRSADQADSAHFDQTLGPVPVDFFKTRSYPGSHNNSFHLFVFL